MKFRLTGKDFQSWKQFDLNVGGFTVIIGSSNRGKSALIRALRGVLRNQVQAAHIRKGEKTTELLFNMSEGPVVQLSRNPKTTAYTVNDEAFSKLDGEVPEPVQALKMNSISMGTTKLDPIFAGQFDSPFMMDMSPADLNAVFGTFSNTQQLNQGKKSIGQANAEANSQAKLLANEIQLGHDKIAKLEEIAKGFEVLRPKYETSVSIINSAETAQTLINHYETIRGTVQQCRSLTQMALPSIRVVEDLVRTGRRLRQAQRLRSKVSLVNKLVTPVQSSNWGALTKGLILVNQYRLIRKRIAANPTIDPPTSDDLDALYRDWGKLKRLLTQREYVKTATKDYKDESVVLADLHKNLHSLTKDQNACPKCGYQLTEE